MDQWGIALISVELDINRDKVTILINLKDG